MIALNNEATRARRASGAIFLTFFGSLWLAGWASRSGASMPTFAVIAVLALALLVGAFSIYRRHAAALKAEPDNPQFRRARRIFHFTNAGQWIAIFVLCNVLINAGLGSWTIPLIVMIVGLHFFPLAYAFAYRPYCVTGAALCAWALAWPGMASAGPLDPVGLLGAGVILWASACWNIKRL